MAMVKRNPLCKGITLSGGEPFAQAGPEMIEFVQLARAAGYEVASYTGYTFEELFQNGTEAQKQLLSLLDILIDGPFLQEQLTLELRFRGSRNQRILNIPKSLAQQKAVWEEKERWIGTPE
jgi:anaerobic ribonucleoside-triphosphate reductase activating protein